VENIPAREWGEGYQPMFSKVNKKKGKKEKKKKERTSKIKTKYKGKPGNKEMLIG
jgi:hypothetical protein